MVGDSMQKQKTYAKPPDSVVLELPCSGHDLVDVWLYASSLLKRISQLLLLFILWANFLLFRRLICIYMRLTSIRLNNTFFFAPMQVLYVAISDGKERKKGKRTRCHDTIPVSYFNGHVETFSVWHESS